MRLLWIFCLAVRVAAATNDGPGSLRFVVIGDMRPKFGSHEIAGPLSD